MDMIEVSTIDYLPGYRITKSLEDMLQQSLMFALQQQTLATI